MNFFFPPLGASTLSQQTHYMKIQSKVQMLEEKTKEAERTAELAEADAREKDKELVETLKRLKDYELVCIFILSIKELTIFLPLTVRLFYAVYCVPLKAFRSALCSRFSYSNF